MLEALGGGGQRGAVVALLTHLPQPERTGPCLGFSPPSGPLLNQGKHTGTPPRTGLLPSSTARGDT